MNDKKMPRTPFSTALSGTVKETQARLKNIFSGPKKRVPVLLLALMCAVCLLCGNLVACQSAGAEQDPDAQRTGQNQTEQTPPTVSDVLGQALPSGLDRTPDLNGNGIPEKLKLAEEDDGDLMLEIWENGEIILREPGQFAYPSAEFLCTLDGQDYLLRYQNWVNQGDYYYSYTLASFTGEFEETVQWGSVQFDTNFAAPFHRNFDPEAIAALVEHVNALLPDCELLFCTNPGLMASFETAGKLEDDLRWLDGFPAVFTRDQDRSLLDNLRDFQSAMADAYPPVTGTPAALPFDHPLEMEFYSGAGSWETALTLNPDGTFTGDYSDVDGSSICYVCQFHGKFGQFRKLTNVSWSMELEELVLDTKYPVDTEWNEAGFHYISSEPNGFTDGAGIQLEPGARFLLYTPQASNESLDGELYGATDFLYWYHGPRSYYLGETGPMGCYGLYNLEQNIGFFS